MKMIECKYCIHFDSCTDYSRIMFGDCINCSRYQEPKAQDINQRKADNIMGYSNKAKAADANAEDYITMKDITVLSARIIPGTDDNAVSFDIRVRGIYINGMVLRAYKNSKGEEGELISFPSRKGQDKDGNVKYYSHASFFITKELKAELSKAVQAKL